MKTFKKTLTLVALYAAITVTALIGMGWILFSMKVCGLL